MKSLGNLGFTLKVILILMLARLVCKTYKYPRIQKTFRSLLPKTVKLMTGGAQNGSKLNSLH